MARARRATVVDDGGETRKTILRAAHRLFMEFGYRAVSTRQIADACGLTQPALYRHFADKQELYVAVLREDLDVLRAGLERIAGRDGGVGERLRQVVRYLPASPRDLGQMFHDIDHELGPDAYRAVHDAFYSSVVAPIASIFADGLRRGLLRDPRHGGADPVTATFLLLSMLQRAPAPTDASDRPATGSQRADLIVGMMLHGLVAPGARDEAEGGIFRHDDSDG